MREKGAERLVELLVDGDEAAEILDAELDAVYLGQIVQVLPDFFERDRHITTPFYHLSEVQLERKYGQVTVRICTEIMQKIQCRRQKNLL